MATIGLDVGGQNSKCVVVRAGGQLEAVLDGRGQESSPTAVYMKSGSVYFGTDALQQGRVDPKGLVQDFKLKLGTKEPVHGSFTAKDIYTLHIKDIKQRAEEQARETVGHCVLTRPANFHDAQTADLLAAAEEAGLTVDAVITEPAAAVMDVLHGRRNSLDTTTELLVVCADLGSTTCDFSVLRYLNGEATVTETSGVRALGGRDLTNSLLTMVLESAGKLAGKPVSVDKLDARQRHQLLQDVEDGKIALSKQQSTDVPVPMGGGPQMVKVSKADYDARCGEVLAPAAECLTKMLKRAKVDASKADLVVWAGGPFKSQAVRDYFDKVAGAKGSAEAHPVLAVARGAARHAMYLAAVSGRNPSWSIPANAPTLVESTTEDYGIAVVDSSGPVRRSVCAVVLPKGERLPASATATFRLERENQPRADIHILQGGNGTDAASCTTIGHGVIEGLPPQDLASPRIELTLKVDASSMLTADVRDVVSLKSTTVTLRLPRAKKGGGK